MIDNGDPERSLEYDTVSSRYVEFVETEVLPRAEKEAGVKFSKEPRRADDHGWQLRRSRRVDNGMVPPGPLSPRPQRFRNLRQPPQQSGSSARRVRVHRAPVPRQRKE